MGCLVHVDNIIHDPAEVATIPQKKTQKIFQLYLEHCINN